MTQRVRISQDQPTGGLTPVGDRRRAPSRRLKQPLCVVGMGGSVGALEAVEQFFGQCPPNTGAGFVLVSHLAPTVSDLYVMP